MELAAYSSRAPARPSLTLPSSCKAWCLWVPNPRPNKTPKEIHMDLTSIHRIRYDSIIFQSTAVWTTASEYSCKAPSSLSNNKGMNIMNDELLSTPLQVYGLQCHHQPVFCCPSPFHKHFKWQMKECRNQMPPFSASSPSALCSEARSPLVVQQNAAIVLLLQKCMLQKNIQPKPVSSHLRVKESVFANLWLCFFFLFAVFCIAPSQWQWLGCRLAWDLLAALPPPFASVLIVRTNVWPKKLTRKLCN